METEKEEDPLLGKFLEFLSQDITNHPESLQFIDKRFVQCIQTLVQGTNLNLEAVLLKDEE
jgi:antitoxin PrlF